METSNKIAWIIDSEHSDISFKIAYTSLAEADIPPGRENSENLHNGFPEVHYLKSRDEEGRGRWASDTFIQTGDFYCPINYSMMAFTGSHFSNGPGIENIAGILVIRDTRKFVMLEFYYEKHLFINRHRRICYKVQGTIHKDDFLPFDMLNFPNDQLILGYEIQFSGTFMFKKAPGIAQ